MKTKKPIDWDRALSQQNRDNGLRQCQKLLKELAAQREFFMGALGWAAAHVPVPLSNGEKLNAEIHKRLDAISDAERATKTQVAEILLEIDDEEV